MPIFDPPTLTRLLGSIEAGHLVVLCGAGLSIPPPSNLMSAVRVARACYDKWQPTETLPAALRDDIDGLAGHFHAQGTFKSVFISTLVPWDDLVGEPNEGHAAVAVMAMVAPLLPDRSFPSDPPNSADRRPVVRSNWWGATFPGPRGNG
jgi:hypothetical protein